MLWPARHTGGIGTLTIENNSRVDVAGTLTIWGHAAVNLVDGVLSVDTIQEFAPPLHGGGGFGLNFTGGTLDVHKFDGVLINSGGTLAPGGNGSIGSTDVNFAYSQLAGSVLDIDIGGTATGQFDQLTVGGGADFDGALDIALFGGFTPSLNDTFTIVQAGNIPLSSFANLLTNSTFTNISNKLVWHLFYDPTVLTLAVVPALAGDFNGNGVVDAADYVVWRKSQGQTGIGLAADADFNRTVDFVDYLVWRAHFGQAVPGSGAGTSELTAVPEPRTLTLTLMFLAATGWCLRRRSTSRTSQQHFGT